MLFILILIPFPYNSCALSGKSAYCDYSAYAIHPMPTSTNDNKISINLAKCNSNGGKCLGRIRCFKYERFSGQNQYTYTSCSASGLLAYEGMDCFQVSGNEQSN